MTAKQALRCFISFSAASYNEAERVTELLEDLGVETYRADLFPGQQISREILAALQSVDFVILIVEEPSPSPGVAFEAGLAIGLGKPVLALATGPVVPFDITEGAQVIRIKSDEIGSAKRDISRFVRHVRPRSKPTSHSVPPARSLTWTHADLARIRQGEGTRERESELVNLMARVFQDRGSEVLREGDEDSGAYIDLLVWDDQLVTDFGGPLIIECKYYAGGAGSVLVNARHAFKQLARYVQQSSATLGLLVFDHDRPSNLSLTEHETPEALAFFVGDLLAALEADRLSDEIRRRRARAARLREHLGDPG